MATPTTFTTLSAAVEWARKACDAGHEAFNPVTGSQYWYVAKIVAQGKREERVPAHMLHLDEEAQ